MSWTALHLEDIPLDERRFPIRRHLGITAFGVNAWRGAEVGDRVIDDHDELVEAHEELYLVVSGRAAFTLDGDEVDAPPGTLVFAAPEAQRGAVAAEPGTVVLAIGAEPGRPFSPSGWEEWADLGMTELVEGGRYEEAAERYASALERHPDHPGVLYNLACMLSLAGRDDEALERLAQSIERFAKSAHYAREDPDFDPLRNDPRFEALTAPRSNDARA
ncbi:MAG TPA: tetratricopeptide repeat protein [Gaiellaceae bacterium]|nr:tetratricopeptide repeat protein [Gaiellaceae bacterium]